MGGWGALWGVAPLVRDPFLRLLIHLWSLPSTQLSSVAPSSCDMHNCHTLVNNVNRWTKPGDIVDGSLTYGEE